MKLFRWGLRNQPPELFEDRVTSSQPGLNFTVAFRVEWRAPRATPSSRIPVGQAGRMIRGLVGQVSERHSVLRPAAAGQEINHLLKRDLPLRTPELEVSWAYVDVTVDEDTCLYAEQVAQAGREPELDALARRQTQARMQFMREEVLHSPASARIFLILENSSRLGMLPPGTDVDGVIREIQQWAPQSRWVVIAQLLHAFVNRLSDADADDLLGTLRSLFTDYGATDLAEQVPAPTASADQGPGSPERDWQHR